MKARRARPAVALAVASLLADTPLQSSDEPRERLLVDASAVGADISPWVYGQFIEHLGRCIYGGLWAEMLEDRKFYYPVTGEAPAWEMFKPGPRSWDGEGHPYELLVRSPWMILGERSAVGMAKDAAYAGEHSPRLSLPGGDRAVGLTQERLGLTEGREYVGRIVLRGEGGAGPVEVSLAWGGGASERQTVVLESLGTGFAKHALRFRSGGTTDNGRLEIVARGTGTLVVGTVSLMPADNVLGWRADTLALLRELDSPVYRWPGGNFVSGYDWQDGIGERDCRPPRKNPAWKGIESNDVGLHEFMALMREIGAEPYLAVNTGLAGASSSAALVQYANGAVTSPQGRRRAENGSPAPFGVKLWAIGNEMYGDWQLGHMPLAKYVEKHRQVVDAMRAEDPGIVPVAVGALGEWSQTMLTSASGHMTHLSEHLYWQSKPDVPAHVAQARDGIRKVADAHRAYRREIPALAGRDIRIALDEWNYWYGPNEYGELGTRYFLQDGLGIAAGLHELFRNSDLFVMANYAQTVNVIGAIKTTATAAEMETTGLVLALYRRHFGSAPVRVTGAPDPLDATAAWSKDRRALTIAIVNPTGSERTLTLDLRGARLTGQGRVFVITGSDPLAHNAPGRSRSVGIRESSLEEAPSALTSPPLSVTLYVLSADGATDPSTH
jgi:alpha-N-arabinofuranosidase